ncbi:MAG: hypothetical protein COB90_06815 [Hyphomicrobiales bacterium]|nr:MAG: hypothetical protein COB90_06815 [Hyphomicrobiales bacterium]
MSIEPLLNSTVIIQLHIVCAVVATILGAVSLLLKKGTIFHKSIGYIWVTAMLITALSSFGIHSINMFAGFSLIHILSFLSPFGVLAALHAARSGHIREHRSAMRLTWFWGLLVPGVFTLLPGRLMNMVVLG